MLGLIVDLTAAAGREAEFEKTFNAFAAEVRAKEPGVVAFYLVRGKDDPKAYRVMELYRDEAALEAHRASEHMKTHLPKIRELLGGSMTAQRYDVLT